MITLSKDEIKLVVNKPDFVETPEVRKYLDDLRDKIVENLAIDPALLYGGDIYTKIDKCGHIEMFTKRRVLND